MTNRGLIRLINALIIFAFSISLLGGCSSGNKKNTVVASSQVKHLLMWKFKTNKEDYTIYDWVKQWNEANPNVYVDLELIPYNAYLTNKLPTAFATNSAPDIYMISAGSFLKYARSGCMLPLDAYIDEDLKKDFYEPSLNNATYNGKIMGIPIEREPLALFYNKKVFSDNMLALPANWEELENCLKVLHTNSMSGISIPLQTNDYQNFIFYSFLAQVGGAIDEKTRTSKFAISGLKALELWRTLSKYNYKMDTIVQSPSDIYPLATAKAATQICGYWSVRDLEKNYKGFEYGAIPIPFPVDGKNTSVYGGWYQVVNPHSKYTNEAAAFTMWMWGGEISRPLEWCAETSSKFPARKSVVENNPDVFNNEKSLLFERSILPNAVPEPRYPVEISNIVSKAIQEAMYTNKDIESIANSADKEINNYLKSNQ